jgi:hypothetical protein
MTTSGTTVVEMSRDAICTAALRKIGAVFQGGTPAAAEITNASEALNNLVAQFQTMGMPLWARIDYTVPMVASQTSYTIGVGQAVNTPFPLKILQAWTVVNTGGAIQELWPNAIDVFNRLPTSGATGIPSQYSYQPFINYGVLRVWPAPDATTVANRDLHISYMRPFDRFTASGNTPYFPSEWNNPLIYGLAVLMAPEYGMSPEDRAALKKEAKEYLDIALDFGMENASLTFAPKESY